MDDINKIELHDKVRDKATGLDGVVTAIVHYAYSMPDARVEHLHEGDIKINWIACERLEIVE